MSITCGKDHSCGIVQSPEADLGKVRCWGKNDSNQLGLAGSPINSAVPAEIQGGLVAVQISGGAFHTCVLKGNVVDGEIENTGELFCFGDNTKGQLGTGNGSTSVPEIVSGSHYFESASIGYQHSCGRVTGEDLYCWGSNSYGQIGQTTTGPVAIYPTPVLIVR